MGGTVKINHARHNEAQLGYAPNGSLISSEPTIIFDGTTLTGDPDGIWSEGGTGTFTFEDPLTDMTVTTGQYCVRQSTRVMPYFAGYPMYAEFTLDNFGLEDGVTKRVGYFSSSTTAPYTANRDGFWLENDGDTYYIKASHNGTTTASIPLDNWHGREILQNYDWDQFTVVMFDHLWLGGASLRMWVATWQYGWVLAHTVPYVGNYQGTITKSPQNHMRYEIRGAGGGGTFRAVCSQYSVLGDLTGKAYEKHAFATANVNCSSTSTIYALTGLKQNTSYPSLAVQIASLGSSTGSNNDTGALLLLKNPTLSGALSYAAYGRVSLAQATTQTVTAIGEVLAAAPSSRGAQSFGTRNNYSLWVGHDVDGVSDEFVVAFAPTTTNQNLRATIGWREYG